MKPMGRRKNRMQSAKHKPKENGKNLKGWWENVVSPCKKRDRREAKEEIKTGLFGVSLVCVV